MPPFYKKAGKYIQVDYLPPYRADIQAIAGKHKLCLLMVYSALTLAMIHPTCLHLCTKLLSKARKGDAIHPEKSALFTIY